LQLIGRPFDEARLLNLAHAYEHSTAWKDRHPAL
jgi:Asp-tRNA(Asn)/Glu-tRNA(Gln) amidotransferase A subunit family amidase